MTAMEKIRQQKEALRNSSKEDKVKAVQDTALAPLQAADPETIAWLMEQAEQENDDLDGGSSFPTLAVHTAQSRNNVLSNGKEPEYGQLFYSGAQTAHTNPQVHLLSVKKCSLPDFADPSKVKKHYLIAGVLAETLEPFVMYIKGMSYKYVWELSSLLAPFTKGKQIRVPKFALTVRLLTDKEKPSGDFAPQYVVKYEVVKDENGFPVMNLDRDHLKKMAELANRAEEMLESIIANKGIPETEIVNEREQQLQAVRTATGQLDIDTVAEAMGAKNAEIRLEDDIPF